MRVCIIYISLKLWTKYLCNTTWVKNRTLPGLRELQESFSNRPSPSFPKLSPVLIFMANKSWLLFWLSSIFLYSLNVKCDDSLSSNISLEFNLTFYFGGFLYILTFTTLDLVKIQLISTFTLHVIRESQNFLTWLLTFQIMWCLCDIVLYLYCVCVFTYL